NSTLNFKHIFQASPNPILIVNETGVLIENNPAAERLFGYGKGAMTALTSQSLFRDYHGHPYNFLETQKNGETKNFKVDHVWGIKKEGSTFPLGIDIHPIEENGYILFIKDTSGLIKSKERNAPLAGSPNLITKNKDNHSNAIDATIESLATTSRSGNQHSNAETIENRAIVNEALFSAIAENFPTGLIMVFDRQLKSIYFEGAEIEELGLDKSDFEGKHIDDIKLYDDENILQLKHNIKRTIEGEKLNYATTFGSRIYTINSAALTIDENTVWALFVAHNITEQTRVQKELQIVLKKVNERTKELDETVQRLVETNLELEDQIQLTKRAEAEAKENQALFVAIAENFPQGIIAVVNQKCAYEYIDGEIISQFGVDPNVLKGRKVDSLSWVYENRKNSMMNDVKRTLKGEHLNFEVGFNTEIFSVHTTPLVDNHGEIIRALFVYNNITEQKLIEKKVRKALKKEHQLNLLKSRFITTASHEFRTPLSAILSSTDLIKVQNGEGKEDTRIRHLDRIQANVGRLVEILDEFLSISKLEEGKVEPKPQSFELLDYIRYLLNELRPNLKIGQSFKTDFNNKKINVRHDAKLLDHILRNLLINAIKYSDEDTPILIAAESKNDNVVMEITDHGIGIPKHEQKNMFKRFFRAQNATHIQGTGLGLNLVKDYVKLMGGSITFDSELGKG
ncbi:hypothetical protein LCGC14_2098570, partial [marine sediment metagenome]